MRSLFKVLVIFVAVALASNIVIKPAEAKRPDRVKQMREKKEEEAKQAKVEIADILPADLESLPPEIVSQYNELEKVGNRGAVLICYSLALNYWGENNFQEAARLLDAALLRITGSSVGDEGAKKARSTFHSEDEKMFRGEPYEQAMVHLLRGLLYMREGDYENARAVFRSGALCDRSSEDAKEDQQYSDDLAEMDYLEALCNAKLGNDKVSENLEVAKSHSRDASAILEPPSDFNTVIVFFSGDGPSKYATGKYAHLLRFKKGNGSSGPLELLENGNSLASVGGPIDNMTFQATTRGGREVDAILAGKAQFKTGANVVGDLAIVAGGVATGLSGQFDNAPGAGLGIMAIGLIAKGVSHASNPAADTRMLEVLDDIYIFPVRLETGIHNISLKCPRTNVERAFSIEKGAENLDIVTIYDRGFSSSVNAGVYASYAENKDSVIAAPLEQWTGSVKDYSETYPLDLYIVSKEENNFDGFVAYADSFLPCSGIIDEKYLRLEYSLDSNNAIQVLLTGKLSNRERSSKGDYYFITSSGMTQSGSFKLDKVDAATGKKAESPAQGQNKRGYGRKR